MLYVTFVPAIYAISYLWHHFKIVSEFPQLKSKFLPVLMVVNALFISRAIFVVSEFLQRTDAPLPFMEFTFILSLLGILYAALTTSIVPSRSIYINAIGSIILIILSATIVIRGL